MAQQSNHVTNHSEPIVKSEKVRHCSVVLCRGEQTAAAATTAESEYDLCLKRIGIDDIRHVPLLQFHFTNQQTLLQQLEQHDTFRGLIFTSPRSVEAVARIAPPDLINQWSRKQNFTVGPKTAAAAHSCGLTRKLHKEVAGSSRILALSIVKQYEGEEIRDIHFLMPCSSIARDELPVILRENGFSITTVPAYDTTTAADACERLEGAITESAGDHVLVVFFSPSNVDAVSDHLKGIKLDKQISCVSIGPTTTVALESKNMAPICTSSLPTAESLAKTILSAITADS